VRRERNGQDPKGKNEQINKNAQITRKKKRVLEETLSFRQIASANEQNRGSPGERGGVGQKSMFVGRVDGCSTRNPVLLFENGKGVNRVGGTGERGRLKP